MNNFYFLPIKKIISETPKIKTFCFSHKLKSKPGQFVMLWVPDAGQKPFSISDDNGKEFSLTVFKRGKVTEKLFTMSSGDKIGIFGPYGTSFKIKPNLHYIIIAGGYGTAPLKFLAEKISQTTNSTIGFCLGAKNKNFLLFENELQKIPRLKLRIATNDGSKGHHGNVSELLPALLESSSTAQNRMVAVCGPELMEKRVLNFCNQYKIPCEISIERYIKCGVGVCGQCAVDGSGICLCKEGPVVSRKVANKITEFGFYARNSSGLKVFCKNPV